jgi:diamine N-acetyltransferase
MKGKKIYLRTPEPGDVDLLYVWENDPSVWHLSNTLVPFSRFDIEQYVFSAEKDIYKSGQLRMMIVKSEDDIPVGSIDLFDFNPRNERLGMGILIDKKYRGQGYASEALDLCIQYCFNRLMLHQVYVNILPDNAESIKLFERKNFVLTAKKRDWLLIDNRWKEEWLFQLINPNPREAPVVLGTIKLPER